LSARNRLKRAWFAIVDAAVRPLLTPFRRPRPASPPGSDRAIEQAADSFNRAADEYYAGADPAHLTGKPFSEPETFAKRMTDVGVIADALRLRPGDDVLELGAGACWLSHFLNRFGCRTIAVDVSPTALALGRALFEQDPRTNWTLNPQFLPYDGRRIPVADAAVDAVVLYDTFHHLPNPRAILAELHRVLRPDGIVAMSEPGRGHSKSAGSALEAASTGVLERELVLEEIAANALAAGFTAARVVIAPRSPLLEIDAAELRAFMGGRHFSRYWRGLTAALDGHHYLLLHAGDPAPTTRRPRRLMAAIDGGAGLETGSPVILGLHESRTIELTVRNAGDTTWVAAEGKSGWTRLGAHLYRADAAMTLVDFDWLRAALPNDVLPGGEVTLGVTLPAIAEPGGYTVVFDLVVEGLTWFSERESQPLVVAADVGQ
jgi:SAM-dependent methyltransferase